jgi:hypothetical protein
MKQKEHTMLPKDHRRLRGLHVVPGDDAVSVPVSDPGQSWLFSIMVVVGCLAAAVSLFGLGIWYVFNSFHGELVIGGAVVAAATLFPAGKWYFAWRNRPPEKPAHYEHQGY